MSEISHDNAFDVYQDVLRPAGILIDTRDAEIAVLRGNMVIGRYSTFTEAVRAASLFLRNHPNA